ncbi:pyridoxamine 5'-phosphate oxidase family protein [Actinomadura viridis]|uniref:Nitroimidazol reductase NimA-like FMN-containing flavoprotein (Pyridoxamine 5'-phosphate oxidase superfamily) n=1 Tax=Actinomadura viridis TaxID=58110 RepID=A0A931DDN4_9ACTN|nr:pyridoxamine 5'-phosphate oxidase family protein [Actinomadura viridis]MBG6089159.1 nitroimidazol reductase NimA-like FMN-containing flavoprotein (pyridoxamine 5'-phosphate oxidase superfamily) [Actinomadura viridis]
MPGDPPAPPEEQEPLDQATCLSLLSSVDIGRIAWADDSGEVVVLPVNFTVDGDSVIVRTAAGAKLDAVRAGRPISFEADDVEPALRSGWSVLVTGPADVVDDTGRDGLAERLPAPWDRSPKPYLIRLHAHRITGHRLPLRAGGVTVERPD